MNPRDDKLTGVNDPQQTSPPDKPQAAAAEITCQQFVEIVTDYFEGALPPRSHTLVEEHLVMCDWCETYLDQIQTTVTSLQELATEPSGAEPSDAVLAALQGRRDRSR
jgi:anti-sigma factor RsiW